MPKIRIYIIYSILLGGMLVILLVLRALGLLTPKVENPIVHITNGFNPLQLAAMSRSAEIFKLSTALNLKITILLGLMDRLHFNMQPIIKVKFHFMSKIIYKSFLLRRRNQ